MLNLKFEDKEHFYINDSRFYVLYRHSTGVDYTLLDRDQFRIRKTSVGLQIKVNKKSGYVGIAIPVEGNLLVGNELFSINDFNGHHYAYGKRDFNGSYNIKDSDLTSINFPILHCVIDSENCFSVSPTTKEEVIITPYINSFQDYVRIETYTHHGSDFVSFFLDTSSNYHLNFKRVSDREIEKKKVNETTTLFDWQEAFFNNQSFVRVKGTKSKKRAEALYTFIDNIVSTNPFFVGDASLNYLDILSDFPDKSRMIVPVENDLEYSKSKAKIVDRINKMDEYNFSEYSGRSKKFQIIHTGGTTVEVVFSELSDDNRHTLRQKDKISFLDLNSIIHLKLLDFQSPRYEFGSIKNIKIKRQEISKLAWEFKEDDRFEDNTGVIDLISGFSGNQFNEYFKNAGEDFNFQELKRLKKRYLNGASRAYIDVSVNRPFFVSCYETGEYFYFVIINPDLIENDVRFILGFSLDDMEWFSLKKDADENIKIERFMEHREVFIDSVKYGGLLKVKKN